MSVSRETLDQLDHYRQLVNKWNPAINLVASNTLKDFHQRHVEDCLQLAEISAGETGKWVDLGSGGGLPGIVLAISLQKTNLYFKLIESDKRKSAFLRTVIRELSLNNIEVLNDRIEETDPETADMVSARALAPLPRLLPLVLHHMSPTGTAWLMKGRNWEAECKEASQHWKFDLDVFPSRTDPDAAILKVTGVAHA
ncbi:MAG: 16S rRNA (guanine(527)-N(7))-methyltransferase RsmG [Alphaproteobacteria bacterium]|nr:16S rRNA (guanine(527)-N(7))-methyltransferase RsmG [Alphaproteobacteria bacterium]